MAPTLEMMRCDRRSMTLSKPGCARLWLSANTGEKEGRPQTWEGRAACVACPVGAASAGQVQSSVAGAVEVLRLVCPRCERPAPRLIWNALCISCYNRAREVRVGRDCKGNRPGLTDRLHGIAIAVMDAAGTREVQAASVTSPGELMIAAARKATGWMMFTRPAQAPNA